MRRGGALGGALSGPSFSGPSKSSLIPVARLDSGSQRMRHRSQSQTGQWDPAFQIAISNGQSGPGPVTRATIDGSGAMDRASGPHWHPAVRNSLTGGVPAPRSSFTGEASGMTGAPSGPADTSMSQSQHSNRIQQQIERGWAAGRSPHVQSSAERSATPAAGNVHGWWPEFASCSIHCSPMVTKPHLPGRLGRLSRWLG